MRKLIAVATFAAMLSLAVGPQTAAAQFPPQDIGRTDVVLSASEVNPGDLLTVGHPLVIQDYFLALYGFNIVVPPQFEVVSATTEGGTCEESGASMVCSGSLSSYPSEGMRIVLRAVETGVDIPIDSFVGFSIVVGDFIGSEQDLVTVTNDPVDHVFLTEFDAATCSILTALGGGGHLRNATISATAGFMIAAAEAGLASPLGVRPPPTNPGCSPEVLVPAADYTAFADAAALWGVDPADFLRVSGEMVAAIIVWLVAYA